MDRANWHIEVLDRLAEEGGPDALKLGYGEVWAVQSQSDPMTFYYCIRLKAGAWVCSCPGYRFRTECKHVRLMREEIAKRPELFPNLNPES